MEVHQYDAFESEERLISDSMFSLDQINRRLLGFNRAHIAEIGVNLPKVATEDPALRFYVSVSWGYVAIVEGGRDIFPFTLERLAAMGLDEGGELHYFFDLVVALRTDLQHGLDPRKRKDVEKLIRSRGWMCEVCAVPFVPDTYFFPSRSEQWALLLSRFVALLDAFIDAQISVLDFIGADEFSGEILDSWEERIQRSLRPHEFDHLISDCVSELGLPSLDCKRFRVQNFESWRKSLALLGKGADIRTHAKRLISQALLRNWADYCPVSGEDLMISFGLPPGPSVGRMLIEATELWKRDPCDRETLLSRLKANISSR